MTEEEKKQLVIKFIRERHPFTDNEFIVDEMHCPVCKNGTMNYSICDQFNGHICAQCTTKNCITFAEIK